MSEEARGAARGTVLVVDDNEDLRGLLRVWLGRHGCRVVEAADGPSAVRAVAGERPDLVLMDLHLPEMDGFATAFRLRLLAGLGDDVPILAISADDTLGGEVRHPTSEAHDVGFTDFVPKPFSPGQLGDILDRYLPAHKGASEE